MAMTPTQFAKTVSLQLFQPPFRDGTTEQVWPWDMVTVTKQSTRAMEQTYAYTGMGVAQQSDVYGTVHYMDMEELGSVSWTHVTYTQGAQVPLQLIEDSQYIDFTREIGLGCGRGQAFVRDQMAVLPFDRAFDSNYPLYDGTELCGTHTMRKSGDTVTNKLSPMSLNWANVWDAMLYFEHGMVDQAGIPMTDTPEGIIFHTSKLPDVRQILENQWQPDSGNRNLNTLQKYALKPVPCRLLSSQAVWFAYSAKWKADNIFWNRISPKVDESNEFDKYGMKFRTRQRFSNGPRNFFYIVGIPAS